VLVEVLDLALVPALEEIEVLSVLQTPCYWVLFKTEFLANIWVGQRTKLYSNHILLVR
jgi:hypothetical protein